MGYWDRVLLEIDDICGGHMKQYRTLVQWKVSGIYESGTNEKDY